LFRCELLLAGRDSDRAKIELLEKQLFVNEADLNLFHRRLSKKKQIISFSKIVF
jgi:hypothetical protein